MGKYNTDWSQAKYERFLKEGRGQGEGADYKPWLTINDYPSLGRATRVFGWKTNRIHHFFTDLQTRYFYILEWSEAVQDIRESFPLLQAEEVIQDKDGLNFDAFKDKESGFPYVLLTTFLITIRQPNGNLNYIARSVKAASELEKKLTLDSLEIQRRYWREKGIDWGIVTNKDISVTKAKNVEWIHSFLNLEDRGMNVDEINEFKLLLQDTLWMNPIPLRKILFQFDREYKLETGTALAVFKHLIATKKIIVNINERIDLNTSANQIILSISEQEYLKKVKTE